MAEQIRQEYLRWKERELLSANDVARIAQEHKIKLSQPTLSRLERGQSVRVATLRNLRDLMAVAQN